jgi:site-specific recombinase XerD
MLGTQATTLTPEAIERYRQWCTARGRSTNTTRAYSADLRAFLKANGESPVTATEFEELAMAWLNLTRNTAAPKTTVRRLTSLRGFARWANISASPLSDYIPPTPGKAIAHPIPEGIPGVLAMIEKAKNIDQRALIALGGLVGCRIGEALNCTFHWVDPHNMTLTIRGKGDVTRTVPIGPLAWPYVQDAYVMAYTKDDKRLVSYKDRFARQIVCNLGARAGLSREVSSHDLRATFATAVYDETLNLRLVQELLGHASSNTTEIYTGVQMTQMREAVSFNV